MNSVTNNTRLAEKKKTKLEKRKLIRKQNESKKERKRNERRENIAEEDIDVGRFFELATSSKKYVNKLNLHEIKK